MDDAARNLRLMLFTLVTALLAAACAAPPQAKSTLQDAINDYNADQYTLAYNKAADLQATSTGTPREEAAYVAGLSAYRLGNRLDAEQRFEVAANSSDANVAGKAKAMLGVVRLEQSRNNEAADLLKTASHDLPSDDAQQAAYHAAVADRRAESPALYAAPARAPAASTASPVRVAPASFALQVGAFQDRKNADDAARQAASIISRNGLGEPRIIKSFDDRSRPRWLVQFGRFTTRNEADQARRRMNRLDYIVAAYAVSP